MLNRLIIVAVAIALSVAQGLPPRGACDTPSCEECLQNKACGWYVTKGLHTSARCADAASAPSRLLFIKMDQCDECLERFTCTGCMEERNCTWFTPKTANPMGSTCSKSNAVDKLSLLWNPTKDANSCLACAASTCEACVPMELPAKDDEQRRMISVSVANQSDTMLTNSTDSVLLLETNTTNTTNTTCVWSTLTAIRTNGRCTIPLAIPTTHTQVTECNFSPRTNHLWALLVAGVVTVTCVV